MFTTYWRLTSVVQCSVNRISNLWTTLLIWDQRLHLSGSNPLVSLTMACWMSSWTDTSKRHQITTLVWSVWLRSTKQFVRLDFLFCIILSNLLWPSMTFYHLLRPLWPSMIKCLLSRPGLIAGPLHSTPLQIISQSIPRLDPIDSKSIPFAAWFSNDILIL